MEKIEVEIRAENGEGVMAGLLIMAAIAQNPISKYALLDILYGGDELLQHKDRIKAMNDLDEAMKFIIKMAKQTEETLEKTSEKKNDG